MNWRKPESDAEWREALSAYLDDELANDDRATLEHALEQEPHWCDELAKLQLLRVALRTWDLPVPEDARQELARRIATQTGRPSAPALPRFAAKIPVFVAGALCGAAAVFIATFARTAPSPAAPSIVVGAEVTISDSQADALLHEIAAGNLKQAVLARKQQRDWAGAQQAYEELQRDYAGSAALRELENSGALRPLERYRAMMERKDKDV